MSEGNSNQPNQSFLTRAFRGCARRGAGRLFSSGDQKASAWFNVVDDVAWSRRLRREIADLAKNGAAQDIRRLPINSLKTSDTLFILGSGASINALSEKDFRHISSHDSLGMNFWLIHPFTPTYYFFEFSVNRARNDTMAELLQLRTSQYATVPFVVEYKDCQRSGEGITRIPSGLRDNVYLHAPWCLSTPWPSQVRLGIRCWSILNRLGLIGLERMIHHRASLSVAVMFGALCGYQKLVLLGVDLDNSDYFWDVAPSHFKGVPQPPRVEIGAVHSTSDSQLNFELGAVSVMEYLEMFNKLVLTRRRIQCYSGTRESALSRLGFEPYFPAR